MSDETVHVVIRQGDGIVARYGSGVLAILPGGDEGVQQALLDGMREACEGRDLPGRAMARRLVGILSQAEPDDVPPFGACAPNERGWAVILHQGVALEVRMPEGMTHLSGYDASTWVDRIVDSGFESLTLLPDGQEVGTVDTRFRFAGGLVPGSGATLIPVGTAAEGERTTIGTRAEEPAAQAEDQAAAMEAAPADVEHEAPAGAETAAAPTEAPQPVAPQPVEAQPVAPQPVEAQPQPAPQPVAPQPVAPQSVAPQPAAPQPVAAQPQPVAPQPVQPPPPAPVAEPAPPPPTPVVSADADEPPTLIQPPSRDVEAGDPAAADRAEMPTGDAEVESVPLLDIGPEAKRDPLPVLNAESSKDEIVDPGAPLVYGVLSPAGYFNHPDALYCSVTGVSMLHRTHVLVQRPRPPLGVVVADDGSTFTLSTNYIVGREPERDPQVEADEARPLKLQDAERSLSRVHAEIRLVDWDVYVVDRGSANGTYVLPRGGQQWKRLVADTPEKIVPGTRIAFGKRVMTFESHHQINQAAS